MDRDVVAEDQMSTVLLQHDLLDNLVNFRAMRIRDPPRTGPGPAVRDFVPGLLQSCRKLFQSVQTENCRFIPPLLDLLLSRDPAVNRTAIGCFDSRVGFVRYTEPD